jgi:hypothetical protein
MAQPVHDCTPGPSTSFEPKREISMPDAGAAFPRIELGHCEGVAPVMTTTLWVMSGGSANTIWLPTNALHKMKKAIRMRIVNSPRYYSILL